MGPRSLWYLMSAALVTATLASRSRPPWLAPVWLRRGGRPLDLNGATAAELAELPGIGPVRAAAIVAHRARREGFRGVVELCDVEGIGPRTVAGLRGLVVVGPEGHA